MADLTPGQRAILAHRRLMLSILPGIVRRAKSRTRASSSGQVSLFDGIDDIPEIRDGSAIDPEPTDVELALGGKFTDDFLVENEKKVLGFYWTVHPLEKHREVVAAFSTHDVSEIIGLPDSVTTILGGLVKDLAMKSSKARSDGLRTAKFQLEDDSGTIKCVAWPDVAAGFVPEFCEGMVGFLIGKVAHKLEWSEVIVDRVVPVADFARIASGILVDAEPIPGVLSHGLILDRLASIASGYPGNLDLYVVEARKVRRGGIRVRPDPGLLAALRADFGADSLRWVGPRGIVAMSPIDS